MESPTPPREPQRGSRITNKPHDESPQCERHVPIDKLDTADQTPKSLVWFAVKPGAWLLGFSVIGFAMSLFNPELFMIWGLIGMVALQPIFYLSRMIAVFGVHFNIGGLSGESPVIWFASAAVMIIPLHYYLLQRRLGRQDPPLNTAHRRRLALLMWISDLVGVAAYSWFIWKAAGWVAEV